MSKPVIEQMVRAVTDGYSPRSVYETSLTYHPGSTVKVNKDTKGMSFPDGAEVAVTKGSLVNIVGVGAGPSGKDHLVRLPDGSQATIPFYDLGESKLRRVREDDPTRSDDEPGMASKPEADDEPTETDDNDDPDEDDDDARVVRVELSKPLSSEAEDWLKSGYKEAGIELPDMPEDDQPDNVTFLMKAKDQEGLGKAIGELKKVAAENIAKIEPASKEDWMKA